MAFVQNTNKNAIGVITLDDIDEEPVAEIEDELDKLPKKVYMLSYGL